MNFSPNQPGATSLSFTAPSEEDVERISSLTEPVSRNLQITSGYSELSAAFATRFGPVANWCTFAKWASKQAGVTIRSEDVRRKLEEVLKNDTEIREILGLIAKHLKLLAGEEAQRLHESALAKLISAASKRAADAVARGNKKVFEEIAREFARFISTPFNDKVCEESSINDFCKRFVPGTPPDGQDYLAKAFRNYYASFFENDSKKRDELIFLANLQIGYHEQIRLQPEIAESLNAGLVDPQHVRDYVSDLLVSRKNWWGKIVYFFQWLIGKTNVFKKQIDNLVLAAQSRIRRVITDELITLTVPPDNCIRLGKDVLSDYPDELKTLANAELLALIDQINLPFKNQHSVDVTDWGDLSQRLYFIANLFRTYQFNKELFDKAFSPEQIDIIKSGGIPEGRL